MLTKRKYRRWTAKRLRQLRKLVLAGLNDVEIAELMRANRNVVQRQRVRFGLTSPGHRSPTSLAKLSATLKRVKVGEHTEIARIHAAKAGWPGADGPGQARVQGALEKGPHTARTLAAALGIRHDCACVHLRRLRRSGFVAVERTRMAHASHHRWERVWRLADGVRRHSTNPKHRDPRTPR